MVDVRKFENKFPGLFMAFEGIDYSGKSTAIPRIRQWSLGRLNNKYEIKLTAEPTKDSHFGLRAREIFTNEELFKRIEPIHLQDYFALDGRVHLQSKIVPTLRKGDIVLTDRWRLSSVAYGAARGSEPEMDILLEMNINRCGKYFVWPDAIFLFDLDVGIAIDRAKDSGRSVDEFEKRDFLEGVRENYLTLAKSYPNIHVVDASRPIEEVFVGIRQVLDDLFKENSLVK